MTIQLSPADKRAFNTRKRGIARSNGINAPEANATGEFYVCIMADPLTNGGRKVDALFAPPDPAKEQTLIERAVRRGDGWYVASDDEASGEVLIGRAQGRRQLNNQPPAVAGRTPSVKEADYVR